MKKKLALILILSSFILWFFISKTQKSPKLQKNKLTSKQMKSITTNSIPSTSLKKASNIAKIDEDTKATILIPQAKISQELLKNCNFNIQNKKITREYHFGKNVHFSKNNTVYRTRFLLTEGQQSQVYRVINFKEDSDGFPQIISHQDYGLESEALNAFKKSYQNHKIEFEDQDSTAEFESGEILKTTFENGSPLKYQLITNQQVCEGEF